MQPNRHIMCQAERSELRKLAFAFREIFGKQGVLKSAIKRPHSCSARRE
jgi:hypothetical protein